MFLDGHGVPDPSSLAGRRFITSGQHCVGSSAGVGDKPEPKGSSRTSVSSKPLCAFPSCHLVFPPTPQQIKINKKRQGKIFPKQ